MDIFKVIVKQKNTVYGLFEKVAFGDVTWLTDFPVDLERVFCYSADYGEEAFYWEVDEFTGEDMVFTITGKRAERFIEDYEAYKVMRE